ncbi:MAG: hypothetical protein ACPL4H_05895 [Anaerolineales bacterium]
MNLSIFSQTGPAQTTDYMIAGYAVIIGVMAIYLISIWLRKRSLMRQWELLKAIQDKDK